METIEKLKGSRKAYRAHLTRIYGKIGELNLTQPANEETTSLVMSYIDQLNRKAEAIQQLDLKIQSLIEGAEDTEQDTFEAIEIQDTIIENTVRLKRYIEKNNATNHSPLPAISATEHRDPVAVHAASASRLPKLELPRFSGNPLQWQSFWDAFQAAVHSNPRLTDVEKFNYLRSQLDGEAARTVSGFALTNANYAESISLLKSRFGKEQRVINAHMKALLDLPVPSNNPSSLRRLYDTIESHIRGLESLGSKTDTSRGLLVSLILGKLPSAVIRNLNQSHTSDHWEIDELRAGLEREITILESGLENHEVQGQSTLTGSFVAGVRKGQTGLPFAEKKVITKPVCVYCKGPHSSLYCNGVTDPKMRLDIVKKERLCFNCLGNHKAAHCNSKNRCKSCHKKHHSSLCGSDNAPPPVLPKTNPALQTSSSQSTEASQSTLNPSSQSFVPTQPVGNYTTTTQSLVSNKDYAPTYLLKTAIAFVRTNNRRVTANILFDEGAQRSFVTQALADKLDSEPHCRENLSISSFGGDTTSKYQVDTIRLMLETNDGDVAISALVVPQIAAPVQNFVNPTLHALPHLRDLQLAHPVGYSEKFHISLLIGVDHYWEIVGNHIVRGTGPVAMESKLGYLLSGPLPTQEEPSVTHAYTTLAVNLECSDCPENNSLTTPSFLEHGVSSEGFMETYQKHYISRDEDGNYVVRFPWRPNPPVLPTNHAICERQTRTLAKKLGRQPTLLKLYGNIIAEQEQRQFIERATENDTPSVGTHYIPHHPVYKKSSTTPVRIVYNCSCRQSPKQASLNDCLLVGDTPLIDVCEILLRFRLHQYALSTDIEKAFLHVKLDERDRDFTRFLWLSNPHDPESPFITYRFKVVLFGSTSSPFMLSATLHHHLDQYQSAVSNDIKRNLYVDNVISGCHSVDEILKYYETARTIMSNAHFNLRSWASNCIELQTRAQADGTLDSDTSVNVLGLKWNTSTDTLALSQQQITCNTNATMTKRSILQAASKQYDPLGWLSPILIWAKLLIQELWRKQVSWDEPLDDGYTNRWVQVATDIEQAATVIMKRRYSVMLSKKSIFLHVFADASTKAYGAVAYLQSDNYVDFVMAKSRVSPLKSTTLPRLELKAAVIAAQLADSIQSALKPKLCDLSIKLWSDSQIALHWIYSKKRLMPYVANRVREICLLFPNSVWGYCPTDDNAADLLTRGISSVQLQSSSLWSQGPPWLTSEPHWPVWSPTSVLHITTDEEIKSSSADEESSNADKTGVHQCIDINRHSTLAKLYRTTAYVRRFIENAKGSLPKLTGPLSAAELHHAQTLWIKSAQQQSYYNELVNLQSKSSVRLPLIRQLRLYLNKDSIICCSGRVHNAPIALEAKFPYLLPQKHRLTELIIKDVHQKHFHSGTNSTVTYIRQRYWLPAARQRVRSILRHCVTCNKLSGSHYKVPDSPPLPKERLQMMKPFTVTGVDYTGALYVRTPNGESKVYICLFTCASSRAVHLEVVTDLSEESFLHAFRRFASRKSLPKVVVSDNASTFMSAAEDLKALFESGAIQENLARQGVDWKFIPCRAPWYGGYWERLIGLTKSAIKKTLGRSHVTLSSLQTIIVEIEAHLNNRPLTYVSSDLNEPEPLTPSHLLYGRIIDTLPHSSVTEEDILDEEYQQTGCKLHNTLSKKAKAQAMIIQHFWNRWKREYLTSLREVHKVNNVIGKEGIKVGDVVVIHDDTPRLKWQLAVVKDLQRGKDDVVRSATIRTVNGVTSRPIVKLYPLEINVEADQNVQSQENVDKSNPNDVNHGSHVRPQRSAAVRARTKVSQWAHILGGPEDVVN